MGSFGSLFLYLIIGECYAKRQRYIRFKSRSSTKKKDWCKANETRKERQEVMPAKKGLYANIHAKKKRIAAGSGEKMRKPGAKGAPTAKAFKKAAKTAKKRK